MKYMGSKNRIAKYILPIILQNRKDGQWYVEPFVGGANIIDKVKGKRIGSDINPYNIELFKGLQNGLEFPDFISEEQYKEFMKDKRVDALTAFVGYGCSYSGKFFGGYARGDNKGVPRNYCLESKKNLSKQYEGIKGVEFICSEYDKLSYPENSIIYCDPPYKGTTKYKTGLFDYEYFYDWCRNMSNLGHEVYISEYNMPDDFTCLWSMEVNSSLTKDTGSKKAVEKLFTYKKK